MSSSSSSSSTGIWIKGILPTVLVGTVVVAMSTAVATRTWRFLQPRNDDNDDNNIKDKVTADAVSQCIYLDYNGTTPIYRNVYDAMIPYFTKYYGNPGSTHVHGTVPRNAIQQARYQILKYLFQCPHVEGDDDENQNSDNDNSHMDTTTPLSSCIFTSCGTEADNFIVHVAIQLWELRNPRTTTTTNHNNNNNNKPHIITTNIEHPAIDACLQMYEQQRRCTVTRVPVQTDGRVLASDVISAIQTHAAYTILVTMMLANNETGAIQPVAEVAQYCRRYNQSHTENTSILFATDAAQATGKISVTLQDLGYPDIVVIVGHKFGTPKGIGCMYIRPGCLQLPPAVVRLDETHATTTCVNQHPQQSPPQKLHGLLLGGGQEYQWRGGTSNVPYIVGLGVAAQHTAQHLDTNHQHMECMRARLLTKLIQLLGAANVLVHGPSNPEHRLPNTLSIGFGRGINSGTLLHELRNVVAASAGATCHSSDHGPVISTVLQAMQIPDDWARSTIRLSVGPPTTPSEVDQAASLIAGAIQRQWNDQKV
jgi:cysteine desulfurase